MFPHPFLIAVLVVDAQIACIVANVLHVFMQVCVVAAGERINLFVVLVVVIITHDMQTGPPQRHEQHVHHTFGELYVRRHLVQKTAVQDSISRFPVQRAVGHKSGVEQSERGLLQKNGGT